MIESQQNPAKTMKPTGIVRDPSYLLHDMGSYHPESPERLAVIYQMIDEMNPNLNLLEIPARDATVDEIDGSSRPEICGPHCRDRRSRTRLFWIRTHLHARIRGTQPSVRQGAYST